MTDSLDAGAISAAGLTTPDAAVQALAAGADMVIFANPAGVAAQTGAIQSAIVSAVADQHLERSRLVAAAGAVLAVRHVDLCA